MNNAGQTLYKAMSVLVGIIVGFVAFAVDWWPWSLFGLIPAAAVAVGVAVLRMIDFEVKLDREATERENARRRALAQDCVTQNAAILEGGDRLAYGFYGNHIPDDEFNVFSDHWDTVIAPEPELTPEEACVGEKNCGCTDCARERVARRQARRHDVQRCHCAHCAGVRRAFGGWASRRAARYGLRQPVAGKTDPLTGEVTTVYSDGTMEQARADGVVVREYGLRDPVRVLYPEPPSRSRCEESEPEDELLDWWDER